MQCPARRLSEERKEEHAMWEVYEFLARGGPIMVPIALGSVTALAILFERLWSLRRTIVNPPRLLSGVRSLVAKGDHDKAIVVCEKSTAPLARILEACLKYRTLPRGDIKEAIEDVGRREIGAMSRLIEALGIIAAVSPLLGLLGTVTGMIQAFRQVVTAASRGAIDPSRLANGIWEALITTAAGLSVAIMAYLAYRYLQGRVNRLTNVMELEALSLLDVLTGIETKSESKKSSKKEGSEEAEEADS
jgi:biopolymer transport protein ExbB